MSTHAEFCAWSSTMLTSTPLHCFRYDGPTAYLAKKWRKLLYSQALEANTRFYGDASQPHDEHQLRNVNFVLVKTGYITVIMLLLFTLFLLLNEDVQEILLEQVFLLSSLGVAAVVSAANHLANNFKYTMITVATCSGLFIVQRCARKHKPLSRPDHDHEDGDHNHDDDHDNDGAVAGVADDGVVVAAVEHITHGVAAMPDQAAHDLGALQIEAPRAPCVESGHPDYLQAGVLQEHANSSLLAINVQFEA